MNKGTENVCALVFISCDPWIGVGEGPRLSQAVSVSAAYVCTCTEHMPMANGADAIEHSADTQSPM